MRKYGFRFLVFIFCGTLFCEELSFRYSGFDGDIRINKETEKIDFKENLDSSLSFSGHYEYISENKIPFFIVDEKKILALHSKSFIFLYTSDDEGLLFGLAGSSKQTEFMHIGEYYCSSYLKEDSRDYLPKYLGYAKPHSPWVEGVEGNGIGEKIKIKWPRVSNDIAGIIFSNGFVSHSRPDLYMKNSRVKLIQINSLDNSFSFEAKLEDTPNPQNIVFPELTNQIEITILDAYPGDLWEDTCINFIWGVSEPIKYMLEN